RASVFVPVTFRGTDYSPASIPNHDNRGLHWIHLFARLEPGISREAAAAAINARYRAIVNEIEAPLQEEPKRDEAFRTKSLVLEPGAQGQSLLFAPARERLEMLLAVSGVVLLLCCANVAGPDAGPRLGANGRDGRADFDGRYARPRSVVAARRVAGARGAGRSFEPASRVVDPAGNCEHRSRCTDDCGFWRISDSSVLSG